MTQHKESTFGERPKSTFDEYAAHPRHHGRAAVAFACTDRPLHESPPAGETHIEARIDDRQRRPSLRPRPGLIAGRVILCAAFALAACQSSLPPVKSAETPPEAETTDEEPEELVGDGSETTAIDEVPAGDLSEMSEKLAVLMMKGDSEFVRGHVAPLGFEGDGPPDVPAREFPPRLFGQLALGSPTIEGGCAPDPIERAVRRRAGALRACYEQRLQVRTELAGEVELRVSIDAAGKVSHRAAKGLDDAEVLACLERTIGRVRFEPPGRLCVATYRLTFMRRR